MENWKRYIHIYLNKKTGYKIPASQIDFLITKFNYKKLKANKIIALENSVDTNSYILLNGLLCCYYETEKGEKKIITDFVKPGELMSFVPSQFKLHTAWCSITTVTEIELLYIKKEDLDYIINTYLAFSHFYIILLNKYLQRLDKRLTYLVLQNAVDRYRKFKKDMNKWVNDIAIFEIASYLDISPETLSRIRKEDL